MKALTILLLFFASVASSQVTIVPPSPNAASLGLYTETAVNQSSGSLNSAIQLFDLKEKSISWPMTATYAYSGYRPSDLPSVLGRGFQLDGIGMINRTVRGQRDEAANGYFNIAAQVNTKSNEFLSSPAYDNYLGQLAKAQLDGEPDLFSFSFGPHSGSFFWGADAQFHLSSQQKLKIEKTVSANLPPEDQPNHFISGDKLIAFKITDQQGIEYYFEKCEYSFVNVNSNQAAQSADLLNSAWYLSKIIGSNGEQITFEYSNADPNARRIQAANFEEHMGSSEPFGSSASSRIGQVQNYSEQVYLQKIKGSDWELNLSYNNITESNFGPQSTLLGHTKQLSSMQLKDLVNNQISKRFDFTYTNDSYMGHFLNKVQQVDNSAVTLPPYEMAYQSLGSYIPQLNYALDRFGYYNGQYSNSFFVENGGNREPDLSYSKVGALSSMKLPTGGSQFFDYELNEYSYVNGQAKTAVTFVQSSQIFYQISNGVVNNSAVLTVADSAKIDITVSPDMSSVLWQCPNFQNNKFNLLLGAGTYDLNDLLDFTGVSNCMGYPSPSNPDYAIQMGVTLTVKLPELKNRFSGGGIRIAKVETKNPNSGQILSNDSYTYQAENSSLSSGEIIQEPVFEAIYQVNTANGFNVFTGIFRSSDSYNVASQIPVRYMRVAHKKAGQNEIISRFTNIHEDQYKDEFGTMISGSDTRMGSYADFGMMRGLPKQEISKGSANTRLQNTSQRYAPKYVYTSESSAYKTAGVYSKYIGSFTDVDLFGNPIERPVYYAKIYQPSSIWMRPFELIDSTFDENGQNAVVTTTDLFYDNPIHQQITKKRSRNSDGLVYEDTYKYPADYANVSGLNDPIQNLINQNRHTELIEHKLILERSPTNREVLDAQARTFQISAGNSRKINLTLPYKTYRFAGNNPFVDYSGTSNSIGTSNYDEILAMAAYDTLGNPLHWIEHGLKHQSALWAYGGNLPVAMIDNADLAQVNTALSTAGSSQPALRSNYNSAAIETLMASLRLNLPVAMLSSFTHRPLIGLSTSTSANGLRNSYLYDSFQRLDAIKDHEGNLLKKYNYRYGSGSNLVLEKRLRTATTDTSDANNHLKALINYNFIDLIGRNFQGLGYKQSPDSSNNILSFAKTFDLQQRETTSNLPLPLGNNNIAPASNVSALNSSFYGDGFAYSENTFENSALNRVKSNFGPGNAWRTANKKTQIFYESAGTEVRNYSVNSSGDIVLSGTYPANSLFKKRMLDEQGHENIEYTDKRGRMIEKRQQLETGLYAHTHYIYDGLGRPKAIIQPMGFELNSGFSYNSTNFQNWVFFYNYDFRGRNDLKHVPAAGFTKMIYDKKDRLVMHQDALQATLNKWNFQKYDAFDREVFRGETFNSNSQSVLQSAFNSHAAPDEVWSSGGGYNGGSFPTIANPSGNNVQQYTFYDQYDFRNALAPSFVFNNSLAYHSPYGNSKGLQTGSVSYHSDNHSRYNLSISFFDSKNREIQSIESHVKSTANDANPITISTKYNFAGEEIESRTNAQFAAPVGTQSQTLKTDRDHVGRPTALFLSQNGSAFEQIMQLGYDAIGRNIQKKFMPNGTYIFNGTPDYITRPPSPSNGTVDIAKKAIFLNPGTTIAPNYHGYINPNANGGTSISGLQTMDFSWHIRGLKNGVNLDANGNPNNNLGQGDLFASKLDFETANSFNGNISKQTWQHQAKNRSFTYSYDRSDKLKNASFIGFGAENFGLSQISYDKNGNILSATRNGNIGNSFGLVDNLSYFYSGNRLTGVTDAVSGNPDVGDLRDNGSNADYGYLPNGSLASDLNRGIASIEYNTFLKKIAKINYSNGNWISFVYSGEGTLLKKVNSTGGFTEFVGNYILKNNELFQQAIPDGRVVYEAVTWKPEFEYWDIWNNLRVSFTAEANNLVLKQTADYDAFGWVFNETSASKPTAFKFQNQQRIDDFGLNLDLFKFRASDPQIGRLLAIDPLAESYAYNSPFALQENKFGKGIELEGSELAEFGKWLDKKVDEVLSWTDVDDATVIATHFTRNGNAIHVDGTPATKTDKYIAAGGVLLPFISGSAANKLTKKTISYLDSGDKLANSSKAARREAMREAGIPTSQALIPDKATKSKDKVFLTRDSKNTVQDAKNDISHSGQPHWEAGPTKQNSNDPEGFVRGGSGRSTSNKPQMGKPKSKVYYEEK